VGEPEEKLDVALGSSYLVRDTARAMSQENIEHLRRSYEHVERTGEILREDVHPDFVWDMTTFRGAIFLGGTYEGVDGANEWLAEWLGSFESWSLDVEEIFDAGDQVVAITRQQAKPKHGGPEVEMRIAQVWTFRDGLMARMEMYAERNEALEAAGLRE
jgi:ketosteroid isomerase-like protein